MIDMGNFDRKLYDCCLFFMGNRFLIRNQYGLDG